MSHKMVAMVVVGVLVAGGLAYAAMNAESIAELAENLRGAAKRTDQYAKSYGAQFVVDGVATRSMTSISGCDRVLTSTESQTGGDAFSRKSVDKAGVSQCTVVFKGAIEPAILLWISRAIESPDEPAPTAGLVLLARDGSTGGGFTFERAHFVSFTGPAFNAASKDERVTYSVTFQPEEIRNGAPSVSSTASSGGGKGGAKDAPTTSAFSADLSAHVQRISALRIDRPVVESPASSEFKYMQYAPSAARFAQIEMTFAREEADAKKLTAWFDSAMAGQEARKEVSIQQLDGSRKVVNTYVLHDVVPVALGEVSISADSVSGMTQTYTMRFDVGRIEIK